MKTSIIHEYTTQRKAALLDLLLKLQVDYFKETVSPQQQEISKAKDDRKAFSDYIAFIEQQQEDWKILLAITPTDKVVGFIIGSVTTDDDLELSPIGKIEDWFVEEDYRKGGVGGKLYTELENWFKTKGCKQVLSDTWMDNTLSIDVHKQIGFFVTGIQFGKKL